MITVRNDLEQGYRKKTNPAIAHKKEGRQDIACWQAGRAGYGAILFEH